MKNQTVQNHQSNSTKFQPRELILGDKDNSKSCRHCRVKFLQLVQLVLHQLTLTHVVRMMHEFVVHISMILVPVTDACIYDAANLRPNNAILGVRCRLINQDQDHQEQTVDNIRLAPAGNLCLHSDAPLVLFRNSKLRSE